MSDIPHDYIPNDSSELSDTQKLGKSMKWFGISRLVMVGSTFLITFIASFATSPSLDPNSETYLDDAIAAIYEYLNLPWAIVYVYIFKAAVIAGLGYLAFNLYSMNKNSPGDQTFERVNYFFLGSFGLSLFQIVLSIILEFFPDDSNSLWVYVLVWSILILNLGISGLAIAGYYKLNPWSVLYEQEMGAAFPILSSRIRRVFLGEILVLSGIVVNLFSIIISLVMDGVLISGGFSLGLFTLVGEILVGSNLVRSGKLLELETFPQQPNMFYGGQRPPQQPQSINPEFQYQPPQKLIPDEAFFCPSCGSKLESVSQDFCMKCGKKIHPDNKKHKEK
jgi:hypothetical protein